jgi:polar amino acid transport system substrate-binding protein
MLKKKSILSLLAIVLCAAFIFGACSQEKASNTFRVGIDDTYPPMEYKDEAGNFAGFDIDMAKEIAKRLGKDIEFVPTAWSAIFTGLSSNKYDCIISSLSITEERKKTIAYTRPYIANNQVIVVKIDNDDIKSEADLGDRIVAVQMGTTSEDSCNEFMQTTPFKDFKKYEGMIQALNDLKIGRVEAVVTDLVVGKYFVANDKDSFKLVSTTLPNEPIAIGFAKENQAQADKVDKILEEMMNDGTLSKISEKWFGDDMTKNIE